MARGKGGNAKRGPKPKLRREDLDAVAKLLSTQLKAVKKLVRQIHAEVVPGSTEGTPEPEAAETVEPATETATAETPASDLQEPGVNSVPLPVEAEVAVIAAAPVQASLNLKPANG
jgi:hypothetical protein